MAGIAYYQFIEKLDKEFEERKDDLVKELSHLSAGNSPTGISVCQLYR